jgi:hypothetical protein
MELTPNTSDETELLHLQENARLRSKPAQDGSPQGEEMDALLTQLHAAQAEREAFQKAALFAKNFIEQEESERREFQSMEEAVADKHALNAKLIDKLKEAFGEDAPDLLRKTSV